MPKKRFLAFALSLVLAVGLMPAAALAADGGLIAAQSGAIQPGVAPGKPSGSQISCSSYDVYEEITTISGSGGRNTRNGDYLGPGYIITYRPNSDEAAYIKDGNTYGFTAKAVKTKTTPAAPSTSYWNNDDYRKVDGGWYRTGALEPSTTYYVYVATCTVGDTEETVYAGEYLAWSDWSDPITVKTPAAKKADKEANPITVKVKAVTFNASKVKAKAQSVKASKAFTVKNAKGAVTYKATKDVTKGAMKKVTVAKGGKVTVKRGTKAGTYKLKVRVTAAGDSTYASGSKTVTLAVKVK